MSKVAIIGGGPSGMLSAIFLAEHGNEVHLFEKNEKLGKKLFITGKGRCNVTNACEVEELFQAVMTNPKFLYSSFYSFTNHDLMNFLEQSGVPLKTERGNRVFPRSDHSSDVIRALESRMKKAGVRISLNNAVEGLDVTEGVCEGIFLKGRKRISADQVIVATGGFSYQTTGSTGDGYRFAEETGHRVTELQPSLVPLLTKEAYIPKMAGLSLKNTGLTIKNHKKILYQDFGEMLFTHNGVSGPMILSASAHWGKDWKEKELFAALDLKPALTAEQLDERILREFEGARNKQFKNVISVLFPSSLTPVIVELSGILPEKPVHAVSREERKRFVELTKAFPFTIVGRGEFKEDIINKVCVSVKDVSPNTMESKKTANLYFAGEVLDVDAVTGGYNLQIAWSTAYLAAKAINEKNKLIQGGFL